MVVFGVVGETPPVEVDGCYAWIVELNILAVSVGYRSRICHEFADKNIG